jgi:4-amino-4-deoxy-L-arabinose transferase-like glycosyltransferase
MLNVSKKYWYILMILTGIMLFYGNHNLLITDNVESNYALTAKEMVMSGDWISPQIYGQYWFDKPILFYTVTAFAYLVFGCTEFASRFFPAIFGLASVALIGWSGKKLYSEKVGFYSAIVLASSFEFFLISKMVITDSLLFFFFSLALISFLLGYEKNESKYYYGFYLGAALAVLTKGPIGILLPGLIITLFLLIKRDFKALRSMKIISGSMLFLIIALPWYSTMIVLHGKNFIDVFFGTHNFLRATVSEHPKDNVFYFYTVVAILALFPWVGFIPEFIKKITANKLEILRMNSKILFLILWVSCVFVFFQLIATKYLSYTYPLVFPSALLLGKYFADNRAIIKYNRAIIWNSFFYVFIMLSGGWCFQNKLISLNSLYFLVGGIGVLLIGNLYLFFQGNKKTNIIAIAVSAYLLNLILINNICLPLAQNRSAKNIAQEIQSLTDNKEVYVYGNYPTSAVFYSGKKIVKLVPNKELDDFKPEGFNWNSKNVMPYVPMEYIVVNDDVLVLLQSKDWDNFTKILPEPKWQIDLANNNWLIAEKFIK